LRIKSRRQAREAALRALYEVEVGKTSPETSIANLEAFEQLPEELRHFAQELVTGVLAELSKIDAAIAEKLKDYGISRVATVDRNLLRLACFEFHHRPEIPPKVTLNEAIELAKKYSTAERVKFVNGVPASILEESPKANWIPPAEGAVMEETPIESEPEIEQVTEDSPELQELAKVGKWKLRSEDSEP